MSESEETKLDALVKKVLGVTLLVGIGAFFLLKPGDVVLAGGRWDLTFPTFSKVPIGVGVLMVAASIYSDGRRPNLEKILSRIGEVLVGLGFILSFIL
ncbi:MAG: hypothetical protein ACJAR0_003856 [Candidatus Azotimanducaceae bacterium]|jgi:hypothetical protein